MADVVSKELDKPFRVGVFSSIRSADEVVARLLAAGFTKREISVVCSDEATESHFREFEHERPAGTNTPAAVAVGGSIGAVLGGLTAIGVGAATGGVGLLVAGGAAAWTGGVFGGFLGAMASRGTENELSNFYNQAVVLGRILVGVEIHGDGAEARLHEAERILAESGAEPLPLPEG
jgi:hypothetical protein